MYGPMGPMMEQTWQWMWVMPAVGPLVVVVLLTLALAVLVFGVATLISAFERPSTPTAPKPR